jgi:hypothetical protein
MTPIFLEKFMKWKLLLALSFCFSLLSPLTTTAGEPALRPPTGGYNSPSIKNPSPPKTGNVGTGLNPANDPIYDNGKKFAKTKKIVKVGGALKVANHIRRNKWKYAAGAAIAGASAAMYYRNDIDRIIDREIYSDKWRSEKKAKLVPILYKKINNAKPEKQDAVIEAIQQSLIYYMAKYNGESTGKLATSILESLNIMNNQVMMQTAFETQQRNDAKALIKLKIDEVDRNRKRTNCKRGSNEREYIKRKNSLKTNGANTLTEWEVGHYGIQVNINNKNNRRVKKYNKLKSPNDPSQENYDFEKDHIPSKKAVVLYLERRDNLGVSYDEPVLTNIENNAIAVVMKTSIHKNGRTNGPDNKVLSIDDSRNLMKAMFDDFEEYYLVASKDNRNDLLYKINWVKALIETYIENEKMCLFI